MSRLSDSLKTIFFLLIVLQIAPPILQSLRKQYGSMLEPRTRVGLIDIKGTFLKSTRHTKNLRKYFMDPSIKAILMRIDSGGGAAGAGQAIYNEINLLKKQYPKPIITLSENTLASAAYYVAAATDWIVTAPSTLVGSIGGHLPHQVKLKEFVEQWKIRVELVGAGKYKSVGDPFVDTTPEQQLLLQGLANEAYTQFVKDMATSRKLQLNKSTEWADGKIFTGNQALANGLVNEIGSWTNAVNRLKEKALIEGEIEWVRPPQPSPFAVLFGGEENPTEINNSFDGIIHSICNVIEERYIHPTA